MGNKLAWCFSWCRLNLIHGVPDTGILLKVFLSKNIALFTVTSIHCIQKSTKKRKSETRWNTKWKATESFRLEQDKRQINQGDKIKTSEGKEKKRCLIQEFEWYIICKFILLLKILSRLYKSLESGNWTKISDENWGLAKYRYLENKKWLRGNVKRTRIMNA